MSKPKLLWHSNAPWAPTGYGNQSLLFVPKLAEHYDIEISAFYGVEAASLDWNGIKVRPGDGRGYGLNAAAQHAQRFFGHPRAGLVFTLVDVWVLEPQVCSQFDMVCWTPVDHEPAPPRVHGFFQQSQAIPLGMTHNGCDLLREYDPLYCPHATDTEALKPLGRELARQKLGIDQDAFLVGMVGANKGNPSRKSFVAVLEAFAEFRRRHENAIMYLHTELKGDMAAGVNLANVMEALRLPEDSVRFADQYRIWFDPISPQLMSVLYSAMDVLVNPSTGGGFEIPVIEAQACGVPVIATDFTAMREVAGAGWKVGGSKQWTPQESWQTIPSVKEILGALERCCRQTPEQQARMSKRARAHALKYDIDTVVEKHMLPALEAAQGRLQRRSPVTVPARAAA